MNLRIVTHKNRDSRDKQVVRLVAEGLTAEEIAKKGGISRRTVEVIIERLKLLHGCKNTPHLVATFIRNKIIE